MIRHGLPHQKWRKSSHSGDDDATCVEAQPTTDGLIAIGDSKARARGAFVFTPQAWTAFTRGIPGETP
ncbi:DUF397 domain-containing protein [Streptomyces hesseae]|uniref:DUF397 domain-containing protein n=1 Tax=Streptomyces hesseae TaxID=3075519 RepID=A0ABU2SPR3_9ACTN|nr:DUF397 domain-containing protein [Streptomyces sp. DSM 40473]MDT0450987.1 DUF397 domain-containing protein [Streptomyces sp. DSM 40473]